jgi:hypothetical protein
LVNWGECLFGSNWCCNRSWLRLWTSSSSPSPKSDECWKSCKVVVDAPNPLEMIPQIYISYYVCNVFY